MKQTSIKKNFIMNSLLTMSSFIFPLITFPYVSRVLLPAGTGRVSFATSLINYFNMISNLGIPTYGIRVCAQVRDDREKLTRTAQELLIINIFTTAISYIVLAIALMAVPKLYDDRKLYIIVSFNIVLSTIGMEWLYKALEQYTYIAIRSVIFKFIALIGMFLLIHNKTDYVIYGGITIFAASASNTLNFINVHKYIGLKPMGHYNFRRHMRPVFLFFAMTVATTIYTNLDTVMLKFLKTDTDVGYYNAAVRIKSILVSIVTSLGTVLLPRASYYVENGYREEFRKITQKALNFVFLLAAPMMIYFILFAKEGILLLSGKAYAGSIIPMRIIMPTLIFIGLSNVTGIQILVPLSKEKIVLYSEIAGAITDFVINWMLIPKYASAGAAIGTVIAEFVVLLCQIIALRHEVGEAFGRIHYFYLLCALALGTLASVWTKQMGLSNFITLVISAVLFFGVYLITLLLFKEPMAVSITDQILSKVKIKKL